MVTPQNIFNQIEHLTTDLIAIGLCENQTFPSQKNLSGNIVDIGLTHADNSVFLKNMSYADMFRELNRTKNYNIKMIDGALLSMIYRFIEGNLISHRLSFFPAPNLETFQNEPELYIEDDLYADVIDKRIVTVPIRFDFDKRDGVFEAVSHPISHLTLGQYENCRIPVSSALTPYQFVTFIVQNFYHTAHTKYCNKISVYKESFDSTIFDEEKKLIHIHTPVK